jgi:uncharacterized protein (DUF362 family)
MNRRDFLRITGSSLLFSRSLLTKGWAAEPSTVVTSEGKEYGAITKNVINALGGMKKFIKPGDIVLVKPNMGWDRKPEFAANTHPLVVKAIVEECVNAGAKRVKVFDNPCNEARRCYENSGIAAALQGMKNVEVKYMDEDRYKKVVLNGKFLKEWELYGEALSANVLINVPIAKHHSLTKVTLGQKNLMGIMGGNRGYIHRQIDDAMADINSAVKSHLTIIDATRILTDHGPTGGRLSDVKILNRIIASTDIVAADAFATKLFGLEPKDIPITIAGYKRGLGEMNLDKVKIVKA